MRHLLFALAIAGAALFAVAGTPAQAVEACVPHSTGHMQDGHLVCTCDPGYHKVQHGLGYSCVASQPAPAPLPPDASANCINLRHWSDARRDAIGQLTIARNQLAIAERLLANANPVNKTDAAARVAHWEHQVDQGQNAVAHATQMMDALKLAMHKSGHDASQCPGWPF